MPSRKARSRIYWREQGGERRAYADFRDLGGTREALKAPGEKHATTDIVIAEKLVADRLAELHGRHTTAERDRVLSGIRKRATLKDYITHHLVLKAKTGQFSESWLADTERMLLLAVAHFGATRDLSSIGVADVQGWMTALASRPNGRGATLGGGAQRHHLNVLSNLYRRAQSEGCVAPGYNPCAALMEKPKGSREEARWLEVHEAALLLEAARTYEPKRAEVALPFIYPLLATYLLTGGRETEVLGLEVQDINFDRRTITFRPNDWRRLKTKTSHRTVPLWPQLESILRAYIRDRARAGGLLFPSPRLDSGMVSDFRKALDAVAARAGWKSGEVRSKAFRHTYCAARLQTLDRGEPVSVFTVAREMGHGGDSLVKRVYGHLGDVRHRSGVVEYRVEQHRVKLEPRLKLLRSA